MTTVSMPNHSTTERLQAAVLVLIVALVAIVGVVIYSRSHGAPSSPFEQRINSMTSCSALETDRADAWAAYQFTGNPESKVHANAYHDRAIQLGC